jgi:hypothetical protein
MWKDQEEVKITQNPTIDATNILTILVWFLAIYQSESKSTMILAGPNVKMILSPLG